MEGLFLLMFSEGAVLTAIGWLLSCVEILIFARVILSLIFSFTHKEWRITAIVNAITEPLLAPIRNLLNRFEAIRNLPIDLSVIVLWLLIDFIRGIVLG